MRRVGGDLGIAPGGLDAFVGDRRIVVEMDQIVRHAGMLRLALGDLFQDGRTLELVGVGLVGRRRRGVERQRIMDLRFVVIRIARSQRFHGLGVGQQAGAVIDLFVIGVHGAQCREVVALALRLGADAFRFLQRSSTLGEVLHRRHAMGIPQQAERDAPIGDGALGIGLQHILEGFLRGAIPERVLIEHAAVEQLLRFRLARCLEMHLAQLVVVGLPESGRQGERNAGHCDGGYGQ
jgi:hypothetical protein